MPRKALVDFVQAALKQHPMFSSGLAKDVLAEEGLFPSLKLFSLYQSIKSYRPAFKVTDEHLEGGDLEQLRINALNLLTVWLNQVRLVRIEDLVPVLFQTIWKPAFEKLETESLQIRALTEITEPEAIGWVSQHYSRSVVDAQNSEQRSHREAVDLRIEVTSLREKMSIEVNRSNELQEQLESLQRAKDEAVSELQRSNKVTKVHLSHDLELIRGRLLEILQLNIERLQTGLSALNRESPLIEVMSERAEIVIESLQSELNELKKEV